MLISSKIVKYIRPESVENQDAFEWEYFLQWQSADGGIQCWLFTDFVRKTNINGEIVNQKSENITKIFDGAERTVTLVAEDLTENEFDVISDIVRAKIIYRFFKDGTKTALAIETDKISKSKSKGRFRFEFEVMEVELPVVR